MSIDGVAVLNGVAKVGDTVAVCVRDGNLAAMRVGIVTEFVYRKPAWYTGEDVPITRMKIQVTHTSSAYHSGRIIGVELFDRVVLIQSAQSREDLKAVLAAIDPERVAQESLVRLEKLAHPLQRLEAQAGSDA